MSYFAELIPNKDKINIGDLSSRDYLITRIFNTKTYTGPCYNKTVYLEIDLDKCETPVLPGEYTLKISRYQSYLFAISRISDDVYEYDLTITKDNVYFTPTYSNDPLSSTRRGCIYSVKNNEVLGWDNIWSATMENSLGQPIDGTVELYMTQREGFRPVFKKIKDYKVENGYIFYKTTTKTHYREYMMGKMIFKGEHSLFYKSSFHTEDMEIADNKFIHTSGIEADRIEYTSNGTDWMTFNKNTFKKTTCLSYIHNFAQGELDWTREIDAIPNTIPEPPKGVFYDSPNPPPDYLCINLNKDICPSGSGDSIRTSIQSPIIGYIGTQADIATFTYKYGLYNDGTPSNNIYVKITARVFRDFELIYEQIDYDDYFNNGEIYWDTVNIPLTEYFDEAGRKFNFNITAEFQFTGDYTNDISLRYDYATVKAYYPPTYYRGFDFFDGFEDFASPSVGTLEPYYWDENNPLSVGREILTYNEYSGIITNNGFGQDFRMDGSWNMYSGLFYTDRDGNPIFVRDDGIHLVPTWREYNGDGMALFDLKAVDPTVNVSNPIEGKIKDEFVSYGDSDDTLRVIKQKYIIPKVIANKNIVIIVFTGRNSVDDNWKCYYTYAIRPDGNFTTPSVLHDFESDDIYQLAPAVAISRSDLYVAWQQRNIDNPPVQEETEWSIVYVKIKLDDFSIQDIKNVTSYNMDISAHMSPDIALTPIKNIYDEQGNFITQDCIVHIAYEEANWTNLTPGGRNNDDVADINKYVYYSYLNSSYSTGCFSHPLMINDIAGDSINFNGNLETAQIIIEQSYNTSAVFDDNTEIFVNFLNIIDTILP
ncbi:MAG: hypothetical protein ACFE8P_17785, partial [Promethearchaeota archaeon]